MNIVIDTLKSILSLYFVILSVAIGIFAITVDGVELKKRGIEKESKFAKFIGYIYVIVMPLAYIILRII